VGNSLGKNRIAITTTATELRSCQELTANPVSPAACPAIPTNCSVERLAATIEIPINHQGKERPPKKNRSLLDLPRLFQKANPITKKNEREKTTVSTMVKFISDFSSVVVSLNDYKQI
jgi:hypothetical protein